MAEVDSMGEHAVTPLPLSPCTAEMGARSLQLHAGTTTTPMGPRVNRAATSTEEANMRKLTFTTVFALAALGAGCASHQTRIGSAGGEVSPALVTPSLVSTVAKDATPTDEEVSNAYSDATMDINDRVRVLDGRAAAIDAQLPGSAGLSGLIPLTVRDVPLSDDAFSDITDMRWARMELWNDGANLSKLRMVPNLDRNDTEEFYYDHGRLIMVYWNPDGVLGHDGSAVDVGQSFYFGEEGLISWVGDDGVRGDRSSADFQYWDEQLRKESVRFPTGG